MNETLSLLASQIYKGKADAVAKLTRQALADGLTPAEALTGGLIAGMDRVGADFRDGVVFVPEVIVAARAMRAGLEILRPLLANSEIPVVGKVVSGTVKRDLHDIGKNLVNMMLQGGGFEVIDLGICPSLCE